MRIEITAQVCWIVPGNQMEHYAAVQRVPAHVAAGIAAENARLAGRANAHLIAILSL